MTTTIDSRTSTDVASREELVARAAELVPLLRRNAERCEQEGKLPEENVRALEEAGLLRLTLPRRYGGYEADTRTKVEVYSELGRGCSSTAWVTGLWSDGTLFTPLMPDHVQDEVFADPNVRITVSFQVAYATELYSEAVEILRAASGASGDPQKLADAAARA